VQRPRRCGVEGWGEAARGVWCVGCRRALAGPRLERSHKTPQPPTGKSGSGRPGCWDPGSAPQPAMIGSWEGAEAGQTLQAGKEPRALPCPCQVTGLILAPLPNPAPLLQQLRCEESKQPTVLAGCGCRGSRGCQEVTRGAFPAAGRSRALQPGTGTAWTDGQHRAQHTRAGCAGLGTARREGATARAALGWRSGGKPPAPSRTEPRRLPGPARYIYHFRLFRAPKVQRRISCLSASARRRTPAATCPPRLGWRGPRCCWYLWAFFHLAARQLRASSGDGVWSVVSSLRVFVFS